MTKRLFIDARQAEETRVVVLNGNRIEDFDYEAKNRKQLKGNVYLARVTRVEPSLQAAFVEYGGNRQGFLAFSEIHPDYYRIPIEDREALIEAGNIESDDETVEENNDDTPETIGGAGSDDEEVRPKRLIKRYKIQEVVSRKQIMLVQVVKEERGNKGAALTTYLSLAGRYCVLMPNNNKGGGVSRKITNSADRKRLKTVIEGLKIPTEMAVIVRTAGAKRTKTEITRDYNYLSKLWNDIRTHTLESQAPCLINEEGNLIKRSIRDLYTNEIEEILIQGDEAYRTARAQMKMLIPSHLKKVKKYDDEPPIFNNYDVENQLDTIHSPQVTLKSGGYLVINQTEALVAIDVNSGKSTRERNIEETALKTNLEAAEELARQLRLRDLSGLIVIDFIDMEETRNQHSVERRMKDAMRTDRARIQIGSISHFGLLEMSRQRLRISLNESISTVCPHCEGTGRVRSIDTAALQLLRSIEEEAQKENISELRITAHRDLVLFILNHKRGDIADIEHRFGLIVLLLSDDSLMAPDYRAERIGIANKAKPKKGVKKSPKQSKNGNLNDDKKQTSGNEGPDTNSTKTESSEVSFDEDSPKRRRRGRRGGRRRRRRNGEDSQNLDLSTQSNYGEPESFTQDDLPSEQRKTLKNNVTDKNGNQSKDKILASGDRAALKQSNIKPNDEEHPREQIDISESNAATHEGTKKNKASAKKNVASQKKKLEKENSAALAEDKRAEKSEKTTKRSKVSHKKTSPKTVTETSQKQKTNIDMETKKASKKTREKTVATRKVHKTKGKKSATTSNQSIKDSDTNSSSRSPTSSLPQDVIEVGGEGNSDKRRGWWSR